MAAGLVLEERNQQPRRGKSSENAIGGDHGEE